MRNSLSFLASILLHAALLFLVFNAVPGGSGDSNTPNSAQQKEKEREGPVMFKGVEVTVIEREKPQVKPEPTPPEILEDKESDVPLYLKNLPQLVECPGHWYGGLGLEIEYNKITKEQVISRIYRGFGADIFGLKVGDVIEWASAPEIIGEPGTPIKLRIRRGEEHLEIDALRTKVCY